MLAKLADFINLPQCQKQQRIARDRMVFHALNLGVARMKLFEMAAGCQSFERVLPAALPERRI
jgi:hypothetical protein